MYKLREKPSFQANLKWDFESQMWRAYLLHLLALRSILMKLFARAYIIVQNISLTDPQFSRVNMNDETITHPRQPTSFQIKYAGVPTEHAEVLRGCNCIWADVLCSKEMWVMILFKTYESLFVRIWRDFIKMYSGQIVALKHVAQVLWNIYSAP